MPDGFVAFYGEKGGETGGSAAARAAAMPSKKKKNERTTARVQQHFQHGPRAQSGAHNVGDGLGEGVRT
jgi:hypothetical protein